MTIVSSGHSDLFATGIDTGVLEAQRLANQQLALMPHPDVRTPEGLSQLRTLTSPGPQPTVLAATDMSAAIGATQRRLRLFVPKTPRAIFLRIHGGGWAAGAPEDDDALNDHLARACDVVVASPDYPLTPAVTISDQISACVEMAEWVGQHSLKIWNARPLLIGGISAGAHLALSTLLRLRDRGSTAFEQIAGAHLDAGVYDLSGTPSSRAADESTLVITRSWLDGLLAIGLPGLALEDRRKPLISPLFADLRGLPPAMLVVGALDPLLDDSLFLAARWRAAGNKASITVWPEAAHAFSNMGTPLASHALTRTTTWINELLSAI